MVASRMALLMTEDVEQPDQDIVGEEAAKLCAWAALLDSVGEYSDVLEGTGALLEDVAKALKPHMDYDSYLFTVWKIEALGYMLATAPSGRSFPEIKGLKLLVGDVAGEVSLAAEHFAEYAVESAQA